MSSSIEPKKEEPAETIPFELLLSFVRNVIKNISGKEVLLLAMASTEHETGASPEQMKKLRDAVLKEHAAHNIWPPGFF